MQKRIGRRVYNTEKAEYVGRNAGGYYGDPTGFEELMYKKGLGDFFLFVSGGPESQYPNEDLIPLDLEDAREWIERVRGGEIVAQFITEEDETSLKTEKKATTETAAKPKKPASKKSTRSTTNKAKTDKTDAKK